MKMCKSFKTADSNIITFSLNTELLDEIYRKRMQNENCKIVINKAEEIDNLMEFNNTFSDISGSFLERITNNVTRKHND